MINSLSIFEQTQLAEAAYASFEGKTGNNMSDIGRSLQDKNNGSLPDPSGRYRTQAVQAVRYRPKTSTAPPSTPLVPATTRPCGS